MAGRTAVFLLALTVVLVLAGTTAAHSVPDGPAPPATDARRQSAAQRPTVKLCYLLFGTVEDLGWTFTFNRGRLAAHALLEAKYPHIVWESVATPSFFFKPDSEKRIIVDGLIHSGCRVFFANNERLFGGWEVEFATAYPNVTFFAVGVTTDQLFFDKLPNLIYWDTDPSAAYFIKGAVAGVRSRSCVGIISAFESGNPALATNGAILGIRAVSNVPIHVITMQNWYSPENEVTAAHLLRTHVSAQCDVIIRYTDPRSVDQYVASANASGFLHEDHPGYGSMGVHANLQEYVGDSVLLSSYMNWEKAIVPIIDELHRTNWGERSPAWPRPLIYDLNRTAMSLSSPSPTATARERQIMDLALSRAAERPILCFPLYLRGDTPADDPTVAAGCGSLLDSGSDMPPPTDPNFPSCLPQGVVLRRYIYPGSDAFSLGKRSSIVFHPHWQDKARCPAGSRYHYDGIPTFVLHCTTCEPGYYSDQAGSEACRRCPEGTTSDENATACFAAAPAGLVVPTGVWIAIPIVVVIVALIVAASCAICRINVTESKRGFFAPRSPPLCVLFTEVDRSALLWKANAKAMAEAMEIHNFIIRDCITNFQAYEVKMIGDGFMIVLRNVVDATLLACQIQNDLNHATWPEDLDFLAHQPNVPDAATAELWKGLMVGITIHYCENVVVSRTPFDYSGPDINLASAVLEKFCKGGQILMTDTAEQRLKEDGDYAKFEQQFLCDQYLFQVNRADVNPDRSFCLYSVRPVELAGREFVPPILGLLGDDGEDDEESEHDDVKSDASQQQYRRPSFLDSPVSAQQRAARRRANSLEFVGDNWSAGGGGSPTASAVPLPPQQPDPIRVGFLSNLLYVTLNPLPPHKRSGVVQTLASHWDVAPNGSNNARILQMLAERVAAKVLDNEALERRQSAIFGGSSRWTSAVGGTSMTALETTAAADRLATNGGVRDDDEGDDSGGAADFDTLEGTRTGGATTSCDVGGTKSSEAGEEMRVHLGD